MASQEYASESVAPADVGQWLRAHGWRRVAQLGDIAQRWQGQEAQVVVPMLVSMTARSTSTSVSGSLRWAATGTLRYRTRR